MSPGLVLTPAVTMSQRDKMSIQTLQRQAPSPDPAGVAPAVDNNPMARPSLNAWISAVMTHSGGRGGASGTTSGGHAGSAFAAPAPRKPSSSSGPSPVFFKLSETDPAQQRSVPTPRGIPAAASAMSAGGSMCSGGPAIIGGGPAAAASPPCSQQRSAMLTSDDRRLSEESIPGAFTPWQQPRQVCEQHATLSCQYRHLPSDTPSCCPQPRL